MLDARIKQMLKPDTVRDTDSRAISVGEEAYRAADGMLGADLVADVTFFDTPDILDACMAAKLASDAEFIAEAQGWKWVKAISQPWVCSYAMDLG